MKKPIFLILFCVLLFSSCQKSDIRQKNLKKVKITIDWVPSPEYYGFYYAKNKDIYLKLGYDVEIINGSGAPSVAAQIAAGDIYLGTTTSDNILRQLARNGIFSKALAIFKFNPTVLVSLANSPINAIDSIKGKIIGLNVQSSVYQQFVKILDKYNLSKKDYKEYPIGWGGAKQLQDKEVDGFLAYTTNQAVDLEIQNNAIKELYFSDSLCGSIYSYGLVLVAGNPNLIERANLNSDDINNIFKATIDGYDLGAKDSLEATNILINIAPTLNKEKVLKAIIKISKLRKISEINMYPLTEIDKWVQDENIINKNRDEFIKLFK